MTRGLRRLTPAYHQATRAGRAAAAVVDKLKRAMEEIPDLVTAERDPDNRDRVIVSYPVIVPLTEITVRQQPREATP